MRLILLNEFFNLFIHLELFEFGPVFGFLLFSFVWVGYEVDLLLHDDGKRLPREQLVYRLADLGDPLFEDVLVPLDFVL